MTKTPKPDVKFEVLCDIFPGDNRWRNETCGNDVFVPYELAKQYKDKSHDTEFFAFIQKAVTDHMIEKCASWDKTFPEDAPHRWVVDTWIRKRNIPHPLGMFTPEIIKASQVAKKKWNTRSQHTGLCICTPEKDRHIYYQTKNVETRLRENQYGHLEVATFVWGEDSDNGMRMVYCDVTAPLETEQERIDFLTMLVKGTEDMEELMGKLVKRADQLFDAI